MTLHSALIFEDSDEGQDLHQCVPINAAVMGQKQDFFCTCFLRSRRLSNESKEQMDSQNVEIMARDESLSGLRETSLMRRTRGLRIPAVAVPRYPYTADDRPG